MKPPRLPESPLFSSGPTKKHPGWNLTLLDDAALGRSHRAKDPKAKLTSAIDRMASLLRLPEGYRLGIVPASDTGAVEMAMWSVLGARGVDVLAWESFGKTWVSDAVNQLKLDDCRLMEADFGALPDLSAIDQDRDILFTFNGTTSGVKVPNTDWISDDRTGLTIADATSACFAMEMDFSKLDITTFSWQKSLGGEAAHGVIILSPRAVERLESYTPPWPMPKIFQLTKKGKLIEGIFRGDTINTPSMLCVEDLLSALYWADSCGGLDGLIKRSEDNLAVVRDFVSTHDWIDFLCADDANLSSTSICLRLSAPEIIAQSPDEQAAFAKKMVGLLIEEGAAYDIGAYRTAPPGLRLWGGPTVEADDMRALMPWIDWAYQTARS
ncbi:phosphoserine transaminase [Alphaproteobacteria bacterium]|nr:phosphoserine transaminase [Alphaproteobacteria bacterium]